MQDSFLHGVQTHFPRHGIRDAYVNHGTSPNVVMLGKHKANPRQHIASLRGKQIDVTQSKEDVLNIIWPPARLWWLHQRYAWSHLCHVSWSWFRQLSGQRSLALRCHIVSPMAPAGEHLKHSDPMRGHVDRRYQQTARCAATRQSMDDWTNDPKAWRADALNCSV